MSAADEGNQVGVVDVAEVVAAAAADEAGARMPLLSSKVVVAPPLIVPVVAVCPKVSTS